MDQLTVLITGAGSAMGQSVYKSFLMSKYANCSRVVITNSEPDGASFFLSDRPVSCYMVPIAKDPSYIQRIKEICLKEHVNVIFSGTEHEIYALSEVKQCFWEKYQIHVALSEPRVIEIGTDKLRTWEFFHSNALPFPETRLFKDYQELVELCGYPIFMKPRTASASRNIFRINNEEELFQHQFAKPEEILLQSYLDSDIEYTVEAYVDRHGEISGIIPIRRNLDYGLSVSGEIDRNPEVIRVSRIIAEKLRPQGALNIQLREVAGRAIPFELNTRFSSTECIRAHFGFNAVEAEISHYYYGETIDLSQYRTGHFIRYWEECYYTAEDRAQLLEKKQLNIESNSRNG